MKFVICLFAVVFSTDASGQQTPLAYAVRSSDVGLDFSGQPLPKFRGGFLLSRSRVPAGYSVWDREGRRIHSGEVRLPGAATVNVVDVELSADGESLAVIAEGADSAQAFVSALGLGTPAKGISKVVRLEGFAARHIAFARDGTLWALGRAYTSNGEERVDYETLRHYGRDGVLLGEALPRSAYRPSSSRISPTNESIVVSGRDRIGVLSISTRQWFEVSHTGALTGNYTVDLTSAGRVTGAAITSTGDVYFSTEAEQAPSSPKMTAEQAIGVRKLVKHSGSLIQVDASALRSSSHQGVLLLGSDGDQLVVRIKPPWKLFWIDVR